MDYITIVEMLATIIVLVGVWYISVPRLMGIYLMGIAQILWTIFAIVKGAPFLALQSIVLLGFNIRAIYNWKKKGIE